MWNPTFAKRQKVPWLYICGILIAGVVTSIGCPRQEAFQLVRFLLVGVALAALACAPGGAYGQSEPVPAEAIPLVQAARDDLVARLAISPESIEVRSVAAPNWPDSSLGCPEPERFYSQVVTAGYRILLAANETEYPYHSNQSRVISCSADREQPGLPSDGGPSPEVIR